MRILFISHAYPPTVGGVENQNFELSTWLGEIAEVKTIANGRGKKFLPFWMPYALVKSLFLMPKYDVILLGNALLAHMGWILKIIYRKPVVVVVHGLDLTFQNWCYQKFWVNFFIPKMDKLVCVGNETVRVAKEKGIVEDKLIFIPNGVNTDKFQSEHNWSEIEKIFGRKLVQEKVLMTSGRLARRKGVAWFVRNVMPKLSENVLYIVAGDGADRENIEQAITENNLSERVKMIGYMGDPVRDMLFHTCDLFIQPNIKVAGDMEGFGLSVIEAAFCGIPVIASRLEGLQDAIKDGQDGFLIEPEDAQGYVTKINELLSDDTARKAFGQQARQFVIDNFGWEKIAQKYLVEIEKVVNKK